MITTKPREILCYVKKKNATCGGRKSMMIRLAKVAGRACRKSDVAIVLQNETGTTRPLQDDEKNIRLTATPQVEIKQKKINQKQNHSNIKTKIRMPTICMSTVPETLRCPQKKCDAHAVIPGRTKYINSRKKDQEIN